MPGLDRSFLLQLKDDYTLYHTFIETGTYLAETIFALEPFFDKLYTCEIKPEFWQGAKSRYSGDKISFLLGDSTKTFESLLPNITDKSIFFLDGHWSAGNTGKGEKDCPLYEELDLINRLYVPEAIIIIDDCRLFGKGPTFKNEVVNWEEIEANKLLAVLKNRTSRYYYLDSNAAPNDRLIIHLNSLNKPSI